MGTSLPGKNKCLLVFMLWAGAPLSITPILTNLMQPYYRQHPVASCVAMISSSCAGSVLTSLALGLPAVTPLQREDKVLLAVLVWLAVFFFPLDVGHSLARNRMVFLLLSGMKEIYRVRKIVRGISLAQSYYPSRILIPFIVGVLKGNGSGLMRPLTRLICGVWRSDQSELLTPSLTTRCCAGAAIVWIGGKLLLSQPQSEQLLYNSLVLIFVSIKLLQVLDITWHVPQLLGCWRLRNGDKEEMVKQNGEEESVKQNKKDHISPITRNHQKIIKED